MMNIMKKTINKFLINVLLLLSICFSSFNASAQLMTIKGSVNDNNDHKPLQNAVVMVIRLQDSVLNRFTRTDSSGIFKLDSLPVDTFEVIISHPLFGDRNIILLGSDTNKVFDLPDIILPPKSVTLNEVTVLGYASPVYYKGDTIIYTADSFKVKQSAVVEDLLKKLPGIRVDEKGKIFSQGQAVDQVLVDGDEFFGSDPTIATKNLPASSLESVQVYDKKNESATENTDKETLKVMNLKLKEDAKKGYFGKVSGATDFSNFYEGDLLINKFEGKQKISVFALESNTPRTSFNWSDANQYGLSNDMNVTTGEDGTTYYSYDNNRVNGIPKTFKTGFYYTDQLGKDLKLSLNYTYNKASLFTETNTASQYYLPDTIYNTSSTDNLTKTDESHSVNATITYELDSFTQLTIQSKIKSDKNSQDDVGTNTFLTASDFITRVTNTTTTNDGSYFNSDNLLKVIRSFKNKDRKLVAYYNFKTLDNKSDGYLKWNDYNLLNSTSPDSSTNQHKTSSNTNQTQLGSITYTEPVSKKIKFEFAYDFNISKGQQDKSTKDFLNGSYDVNDTLFSNSFSTTRIINRFGAKFIYELKKQSLTIGARIRQVDATNTNLITDSSISQKINNMLPYLSYRYKFKDNESMTFKYTTSSDQPSMNQLQPIPDNSNPNYIMKGNPDLLPTFTQKFDYSYYSYKPISGRYFYGSLGFSTTNNDFSNSVIYDSIGRTISQPINVQGDYRAYGYFGSELPFYSRVIVLAPSGNINFSQNTNYINGAKNITKVTKPSINFEIRVHPDTIVEFNVGGSYSYNGSSSSLSSTSNQSYYTNGYQAGISIDLPFKMKLATDANYEQNYGRVQGYNLHYLIWDASLDRKLLKNDNLSIGLDATDLLNQNISTNRNVVNNVITDVKTNIIGRYILLKTVFKFTSKKKKEGDDYD